MTDSWWLKFKRAQQHMVDIKREADRYACLHPYKFTRIRQPDYQNDIRYRVRITQQPDPVLSLMLGDFIHNLRSALDHIVVALVPRRYQSNATGFPITFVDPFAKGADGQFVIHNDEARQNFERSIRGIDPSLRAFIIESQPYHLGNQAYRSMLGIISRLDNLDKHRALTTTGGGVKNLFANGTIRGQAGRLQHRLGTNEFAKDDTIVGWALPNQWRQPGFPKPSEVAMQYGGTAVVHIKIVGVDGKQRTFDFPLSSTMVRALKEVRRTLKVMERFPPK